MFTSSHRAVSRKTITVLATLVSISGLAAQVQAQPPAKAEVDPQPVERIRKPRRTHKQVNKRARVVRQDKLVDNFEAMFGRKLTAEQLTQLQKATEEREAANRAAQQAWRLKFSQITGVTDKELKQKQRDLRLKNGHRAAAQPAPAETEAPKAGAVKAAAN